MFERQKYKISQVKHSKQVRYLRIWMKQHKPNITSCNKNMESISFQHCVMFYLLYTVVNKIACDSVVDKLQQQLLLENNI